MVLAYLLATMTAAVFAAQASPRPAPVWSRIVPMPDGRKFVTDGGLAIEADIAKPAALPQTLRPVESGKVFARNLTAPHKTEIALTNLRAGPLGNTGDAALIATASCDPTSKTAITRRRQRSSTSGTPAARPVAWRVRLPPTPRRSGIA